MGKMSDKWTFIGRADVGAGDSKLVWNAAALFNYRFSKGLSGIVGYRALDYDIDTGGSGSDRIVFDGRLEGFLAAIAFHR